MPKFKTTSKPKIYTENIQIQPDGFSSIIIQNIGACAIRIKDNIDLVRNQRYIFRNDPSCIIDEVTNIRFTGIESDKRVFVETIYNSEIK